jgi:5-methyltetrahydrofolate--homocysteine methyltransferase
VARGIGERVIEGNMSIKNKILNIIKQRVLIIDGAMGTQIQELSIPDSAWQGNEGCNELLNITAPDLIKSIHEKYALAGADMLKTNTFGSIPWVMDEYGLGDKTFESAKEGARVVKEICDQYSTDDKPLFVLGSIGPGTKLPSLGHIRYDDMYEGYCVCARGLIDGGVDVFLLETCQDPLQIKAAIHALDDTCKDMGVEVPIMVSATIELSGSMLIGTDASTLYHILEPFDILSLGFNCGTGPEQVLKHLKTLSSICDKFPISIHSNAGLPQNVGGQTVYPMSDEEFGSLQATFADNDGVSFMGGCCGTTPAHINALYNHTRGITPKPPKGQSDKSIASLFNATTLKQVPSPLLIGERSNATGSKAFRELLLAEDYEGTLSVANQQVRAGAHVIDISVGFAGRDETKDMDEVVSLYASKLPLPLMPDSTQIPALETALKLIGGKPILNSVNLEDGEEKFDEICLLAKRYGTSLVCLTIDEVGMAKTKERKLEIAERIYDRAVNMHGLDPRDLVFDLLTFTVGSGDEEYFTAAIEVIEAIRELQSRHPEVGTTLGLSNISFGLNKDARIYLNSVFLHHCIEAGLTSAIVNVKHIIPYVKISDEDKKACEDLLFNRREEGDPLFKFIDHFKDASALEQKSDEEYEKLSDEEKIKSLLMDGDKERMIPLVEKLKDTIAPEKIVNVLLIDAMKVVGELFGSGQMQLPFVLQSAECMKATVDYLNPYLPKQEKATETTLVLGTVKGDVHDVGKNLVDIILSNNGFRVINIGIKAEITDFVDAVKKYNADAIGMSGLLVKSTLEMKNNLEELKRQGIDVPVLLGGAALSTKFIDEYCRPLYDGPIFYCKDAFDGIKAMGRIEDGNLDTDLGHALSEAKREAKEKQKVEIDPSKIVMPKHVDTPNPPFWGRRDMSKEFDPALAFDWLNEKMLFRQRWGYKSKDKQEYERLLDSEIIPHYERLKKQFLEEGLFDPIVLYGYYKCKSDGDTLVVYDDEGNEKRFDFPRSSKDEHRCLSDYFKAEGDVVALSCVSAGLKITEYESKLYEEGRYSEYYLVHGLAVELAEALAEIVHKQYRLDLNITHDEGHTLRDVKMSGYEGCRYSFGYPACPDLELNRPLFELLKPEEFGITLSETYQIHPEQSTSALITYHPEAKYYTI